MSASTTPPTSGWAERTLYPGRLGDKPPEDSRVVLAHIVSGGDTKLYGTVHGGVVLELIQQRRRHGAG